MPEVDLKTVYDAIVVGSGAAGGMAAHVLTSHGLKVLLLEAGRELNLEQELQSMRWPYDHPRRGDMPPDHYALSDHDYRQQPPYGRGGRFSRYNAVHSYVQGWSGSDYSKNIVINEKDLPYTGTPYAWVRARCVGGQEHHLGAAGAAAFRLRFQSRQPRRLRPGLADFLQRHRALLRPGRSLPRYLGSQGKPAVSSRQHLPAADQAQLSPK